MADVSARVRVSGKFLDAGDARFLVKGVTYGTFAPDAGGHQFPEPARVVADFSQMSAYGVNTVRLYTPPPDGVLDAAANAGLRVFAGIPWSQHVAFLSDRQERRRIRDIIVAHVKRLGGHPATLMVALGNEIPASVVRWHGRRWIEEFLRELYDAAKAAEPEAILTYVNYPPTEYLDLPFLDVAAFNVYLHREHDLRAYIARLHHLAGNKPLLLAELGADSIREGEDGQAQLTSMQVGAAFREGACGAIVFAWTDEWWRGGFMVEDWRFGLMDRDRQPKPALDAVETVFSEAPFPSSETVTWPKVSVVICAYNAADTIADCLTSLERLTYPDYEVIVVNDGSRDRTREIAERFSSVRVVNVANGGLSSARNLGLQHATGEIVAYTDADVRVDPDWLTFLVQPFLTSTVAAAGGPNVVPADDPWMAQCVARAPGAPTHVLIDDRIAEHVPGCNIAIRREALLALGGFDPIYVRAGDDVDLCWRIQARGWHIGFAPSALVWHHHRASVAAYWRQQVGYGEGEQWLLPHHPDRFSHGQAEWRGHIYSALPYLRPPRRSRINSGPWGMAPFPSVYFVDRHFALPHTMPWQLASLALVIGGLTLRSLGQPAVGLAAIVAGLAGSATTLVRCWLFAAATDVSALAPIGRLRPWASRAIYRVVIAWLHVVQPFARAYGRVRGAVDPGPAPVGQKAAAASWPAASDVGDAAGCLAGATLERRFWGENWTEAEQLLTTIRDTLKRSVVIRAIQVDDGWQEQRDISVHIGRWSWLDLRVLAEDHGSGKRLVRLGLRLRLAPVALIALALVLFSLVVLPAARPAYAFVPFLSGAVMVMFFSVWWRVTRTLAATMALVNDAARICGLDPMVLGRTPRGARVWSRRATNAHS